MATLSSHLYRWHRSFMLSHKQQELQVQARADAASPATRAATTAFDGSAPGRNGSTVRVAFPQRPLRSAPGARRLISVRARPSATEGPGGTGAGSAISINTPASRCCFCSAGESSPGGSVGPLMDRSTDLQAFGRTEVRPVSRHQTGRSRAQPVEAKQVGHLLWARASGESLFENARATEAWPTANTAAAASPGRSPLELMRINPDLTRFSDWHEAVELCPSAPVARDGGESEKGSSPWQSRQGSFDPAQQEKLERELIKRRAADPFQNDLWREGGTTPGTNHWSVRTLPCVPR